jgi:predicted RNA-binding Zn-ribbon protein involved in translation (DUF1610 family)
VAYGAVFIVVAIAVVIMIIRGTRKEKFVGMAGYCPNCGAAMDFYGEFDRHIFLNGADKFTCSHCGAVSYWDMAINPPVCTKF